jgi:hypothetical protein
MIPVTAKRQSNHRTKGQDAKAQAKHPASHDADADAGKRHALLQYVKRGHHLLVLIKPSYRTVHHPHCSITSAWPWKLSSIGQTGADHLAAQRFLRHDRLEVEN